MGDGFLRCMLALLTPTQPDQNPASIRPLRGRVSQALSLSYRDHFRKSHNLYCVSSTYTCKMGPETKLRIYTRIELQ